MSCSLIESYCVFLLLLPIDCWSLLLRLSILVSPTYRFLTKSRFIMSYRCSERSTEWRGKELRPSANARFLLRMQGPIVEMELLAEVMQEETLTVEDMTKPILV